MYAQEITVTLQMPPSAIQSPLGNNGEGRCTKISFISEEEHQTSPHNLGPPQNPLKLFPFLRGGRGVGNPPTGPNFCSGRK